ncbi:MAG TPA: imidazole glycerol phosphate synthase subunit HisH [Coleofasciculaceae cyanobacterium]|jgi:glutamine amidotransferase
MSNRVSVVDYGMGNLFSVSRALEACGAEPVLVDTPEAIIDADILILPGVGAFADGMAGLRERNLVEQLKVYANSGRPMLGICLGMQMMLETAEEFGTHEGLGLIPGRVVAIPPVGVDGQPHKIPHIGWNDLMKPSGAEDWQETILAETPEGARMYFVHSFMAQPSDEKARLADCDYNGQRISAVVKAGNVYGTQFHPEKSGALGLQILRNFIGLRRLSRTPV